jgi:hypothetical protein
MSEVLGRAHSRRSETGIVAVVANSNTEGDPPGIAWISYTATTAGSYELNACKLVATMGTAIGELFTGAAVNVSIPPSYVQSANGADMPSTKAHIWVGPGPGSECNWHASHCYLDSFTDLTATHVNVNALGAHIVGNYFISTPSQVGPAFIYFGTGIVADEGPDCIITDNVFDVGSDAVYGDSSLLSPFMGAIAQFGFLSVPAVANSGLIRSNRARAGGGYLPYHRDTGLSFATGATTISDTSIGAGDLWALVGEEYFHAGTYISKVVSGSSCTVTAGAKTLESGVDVNIYPFPSIVDVAGAPYTPIYSPGVPPTLPNRSAYFELPFLPYAY